MIVIFHTGSIHRSRIMAMFVALISAGDSDSVYANDRIESIDGYVESAARRDAVVLTSIVDDAGFQRRIMLDLAGRIPTPVEREQFLASPDRAAVVDRLLESDEFALFWSRWWTSMLIGYGQPQQADRECLREWLEENFAADRPVDQVVAELIAAEGRASQDGPANFILRHSRDPVVPVGRLFLGVQLDCARCHDHPSDRWTQSDFEDMARFFARTRTRQLSPGTYIVNDERPGRTGSKPRFLTGSIPQTESWRQELSIHVVASQPFARTMANRLWYHFFGHGITNPPDAASSQRDAPDFPFLQFLAERLRENGFRLKPLIREICLSDAYQRSVSHKCSDWTLMPGPKPLMPDQIYDSILIALNESEQPGQRSRFTQTVTSASLDATIANAWELREPTQGLLQRLNLPLQKTPTAHDVIFRRVLCRDATDDQLALCKDFSSEDVLFALIHSNEFCFWH